MNSSSSSKSRKAKCYQSQSQAHSKMERRKKKTKQIPRNPLQDLNVTNTNVNDRSSNISTSVSVEAPRGCLRFFLSQSSSTKTPFSRPLKSIPKTPKSAPSVSAIKPSSKSKSTFSKETLPQRTVSGKVIPLKTQKPNKNPPCLYHWQSGKKSSSQDALKSKKNSYVLDSNNSFVTKLSSESGQAKPPEEQCMVLTDDGNDTNLTPVTKLAIPLGIDDRVVDKGMDAERSNTSNSNNRTPPVQVSVSPEIQCGSSLFSTATPACFGAGYVVSGVPDKRKCRPRGILTVGDNDLGFVESKALDNFDDTDEESEAVVNHSIGSIVPFPAEASMHWLLSPCNEEDEDGKENSDGSSRSQRPMGFKVWKNPMPFSDNQDEFSPDLCNISYSRSIGSNSNARKRRSNSGLSSTDAPELRGLFGSLYNDGAISSSPQATACEALPEPKEKMRHYNIDGEKSPFSMDTLGSENIMQTPQSESSSDRFVGPSHLKFQDHQKHQLDSEVNSLAVNLQMASLSSKSHESIWDATSSSFQFDSLTMPSDPVDMSQFHKFFGNRDSWISNSTLDYLSQSQMRISWREGLVSRIFELDELDSCRCLSDEEADSSGWRNDPLKSPMSPEINVCVSNYRIHAFQSIEYAEKKSVSEGKDRETFPSREYTCAESISTDGGGLVCSEDSDWTLCYKNHLFKV